MTYGGRRGREIGEVEESGGRRGEGLMGNHLGGVQRRRGGKLGAGERRERGGMETKGEGEEEGR